MAFQAHPRRSRLTGAAHGNAFVFWRLAAARHVGVGVMSNAAGARCRRLRLAAALDMWHVSKWMSRASLRRPPVAAGRCEMLASTPASVGSERPNADHADVDVSTSHVGAVQGHAATAAGLAGATTAGSVICGTSATARVSRPLPTTPITPTSPVDPPRSKRRRQRIKAFAPTAVAGHGPVACPGGSTSPP